MSLNFKIILFVIFSFSPIYSSSNIVVYEPVDKEDYEKELFDLSEKLVISEVARKICRGVSYEAILEDISNWRRSICKQLGKNRCSLYGHTRSHYKFKMVMHIKHTFQIDGLKKAKELLNNGEQVFMPYLDNIYENYPFCIFQVFGKHKHLAIPLTKIIEYTAIKHRKNKFLVGVFGGAVQSAIIIEHTDQKELEKVLPLLQEFYKDCLESKSEEFLYKLGKFYWWFIHAKPFLRGSNSIARVLTSAILKSRGYPDKPKDGVFLHLEALLEAQSTVFAQNFKNFLNLVN
jgi:hypothetical protein